MKCARHPESTMSYALDFGCDVCLACQAQGDEPTPEDIAYEALTAARRRRIKILRDLRTR